jgi:hypothetical protein
MKKVVFWVLVLGVLLSAFVFAADSYTVKSVTGKVEREVSPGKWEAVTEGAQLSAAVVINTGLNSGLILNDGSKDITIKAMQKGTVETLAKADAAGGGIRIGGKVSSTNTASTARGTSNISTASTRASDAAEDYEWTE